MKKIIQNQPTRQIKLSCILLLILVGSAVFAQQPMKIVNFTDNKGLRQGYWLFYIPEGGRGEIWNLYLGMYFNGNKTGNWFLYDYSGFLRAREYYDKENDSDFLLETFYSNNQVKAKGRMIVRKSKDSRASEDPETGSLKVKERENLTRDSIGVWTFYKMDGTLLNTKKFPEGK